MFWRSIFIALLAVGVLAEYKISEENRLQAKEILKQLCKNNGNEDKVDEVEQKITAFAGCMKDLFNVEVLKKEIEDAKPNGALDEVFKKYCAKSPQLKTCIHTLSEGMAPCLGSSVNDHMNSTDQLIDFLCHKDGDRIALFIAEGGPECFQEKASPIRECVGKITQDIFKAETVKKTLEQRCEKFDEVSSCIVKALEECSTPTPGNMAESLFRYIRNGRSCQKQ